MLNGDLRGQIFTQLMVGAWNALSGVVEEADTTVEVILR